MDLQTRLSTPLQTSLHSTLGELFWYALLASAAWLFFYVGSSLGEPLGTLVLTLAVVGIEVMMIGAVMSAGHGNIALARDAMFAVLMIVLNGMVGLCLLLGCLRYHEQAYNLQGANAFLTVIIPLAVLGLVLPNFTNVPHRSDVLALARHLPDRHVDWLVQCFPGDSNHTAPGLLFAAGGGGAFWRSRGGRRLGHEVHSVAYRAAAAGVLGADGDLGRTDRGPDRLRHPHAARPAQPGGLLVPVLVLFPESVAAIRAALSNQLRAP